MNLRRDPERQDNLHEATQQVPSMAETGSQMPNPKPMSFLLCHPALLLDWNPSIHPSILFLMSTGSQSSCLTLLPRSLESRTQNPGLHLTPKPMRFCARHTVSTPWPCLWVSILVLEANKLSDFTWESLSAELDNPSNCLPHIAVGRMKRDNGQRAGLALGRAHRKCSEKKKKKVNHSFLYQVGNITQIWTWMIESLGSQKIGVLFLVLARGWKQWFKNLSFPWGIWTTFQRKQERLWRGKLFGFWGNGTWEMWALYFCICAPFTLRVSI